MENNNENENEDDDRVTLEELAAISNRLTELSKACSQALDEMQAKGHKVISARGKKGVKMYQERTEGFLRNVFHEVSVPEFLLKAKKWEETKTKEAASEKTAEMDRTIDEAKKKPIKKKRT